MTLADKMEVEIIEGLVMLPILLVLICAYVVSIPFAYAFRALRFICDCYED